MRTGLRLARGGGGIASERGLKGGGETAGWDRSKYFVSCQGRYRRQRRKGLRENLLANVVVVLRVSDGQAGSLGVRAECEVSCGLKRGSDLK